MARVWVHVGRLWTNGDPFLAVDADLRGDWRGFSDDRYEEIVRLGVQDTSVVVGVGRAVVVGADGVVRDDSWMEVFEAQDGAIAVVQASGPDYPHVVEGALHYPDVGDNLGDHLAIGSGALAMFSAACDGDGPYASPLVPARPGLVPSTHGRPPDGVDSGILLTTKTTTFTLKVRWYTQLDNENCFARWLLLPG